MQQLAPMAPSLNRWRSCGPREARPRSARGECAEHGLRSGRSAQVWPGHRVGALMINDASGSTRSPTTVTGLLRGIELSRCGMALRTAPFEFPELPIETYQRLPAMVADSLARPFRKRPRDRRLDRTGRRIPAASLRSTVWPYAADRAMGALEFDRRCRALTNPPLFNSRIW